MKYFVLIHLLFMAAVDAKVMMTDLMQESTYSMHKKQAEIVNEFTANIRLLIDGDNITDVRKPNAQADTLKLLQLWQQDVNSFCSGPIQRFINMRATVDVNDPEALQSINIFEQEFKLSEIEATCDRIEKELKAFLEDPFQSKRGITRSLASYHETTERAEQSKVFLGKAVADASSSIFNTQLSNKAKLETLIGAHEMLLNNSDSQQWRSEFEELNNRNEQLFVAHAADIAKQFQKPTDVYKSENSEALKKRITALLGGKKGIEIILRDNEIRKQKRLISMTQGMAYESISFYAYQPGQTEILLDYGWYEKDLSNNNDGTHLSQRFIFPSSGSTQAQSKKKTETSVKSLTDNTSPPLISNGIAGTHVIKSQSRGYKHVIGWLLGLMQAVLMLLLGMQIIQEFDTGLVPVKVISAIKPVTTRVSVYKNTLAWLLLTTAVLILVTNLSSFSFTASITSLLSICCAALCISAVSEFALVKQMKPLAVWFGLTSVSFGLLIFVQLIF